MLNIKSANADDWDKIYEVLEDAVERQKNVNPLIAWTMDCMDYGYHKKGKYLR